MAKFKTLFNRLDKDMRDEPFRFEKPSKTLQEPKDDCDINHIVELYCGISPAYNPLLQQPMFVGEDCATLPQNLLEAYEMSDAINEKFMTLPSQVRRELGDSPVNMLQWICNPANKERGVELGIFDKAPVNPQPAAQPDVANAAHLPVNQGTQGNNNSAM